MPGEIRPGTVLGRYRVRARLGAGAMGEVYLAQDERLDRPVALKVLNARAAAELRRIEREARAASALNHPHILTVYDVDEQDGVRFISTEFIDGETLRARMTAGPLAIEEAVRIATAVADALAAAHAAGVIHRDVKPENVMVRSDNRVKVLDFGIAELASHIDATLTTDHRGLLGTLGYVAPEQVRGGNATVTSDVYALGVVLYEMLTGRRPFDDRAVGAYLIAVLNEDPRPPAEVDPRVPAALSTLVSRMLDRNPERRPTSMVAVLAELQVFTEANRVSAREPAVTRALGVIRHNLPTPLTGLLGRQLEVETVVAMLERGEARLVTVTGPGGVGKTRLAVEVAKRLLPCFDDGVFFVPLAGVRDAAVVGAAIGDAVAGAVSEGSRRLLVLDNFEHVLEAALAVVQVLAAHQMVSIIVTSRTPLRVTGEREIPIGALPVPAAAKSLSVDDVQRVPAVALFVERVRAAVPQFAVTADNAAVIADICRRLDGLPLALELAAARVRLLPPKALLARLTKTLPLLTGGARDLPERHKTLRDAIGWSEQLLAPGDRRAFTELSVFAGGFTLEAAEAVAGDPSGMLEAMDALTTSSLLRRIELPDGGVRFHMFETIREYAAERLAASDADAILERYVRFYVELAAHAAPDSNDADARWLDTLELEHDNLRAAFDRALGTGDAAAALSLVALLWRFWEARGYVREGLERATGALALPAAAEVPRPRIRVLYAAGVLADAAGHYETARARFRETLELAHELGDTWSVASALNNLAIIALREGALADARALYEEALGRWRQTDNRMAIALSMVNLGNVVRRLGEPDQARRWYEESLAAFNAMEDHRGVALASSGLGDVSRETGDLPGARAWYMRALKLHRAMGAAREAAGCLLDVACVLREQGAEYQARQAFEEALATFSELGDARGIARSLEEVARAALAAGHPSRALRLAGAAAALRGAMGVRLAPDERMRLHRDLHGGDTVTPSAEAAVWIREGAAMDVERAIEYALSVP